MIQAVKIEKIFISKSNEEIYKIDPVTWAKAEEFVPGIVITVNNEVFKKIFDISLTKKSLKKSLFQSLHMVARNPKQIYDVIRHASM